MSRGFSFADGLFDAAGFPIGENIPPVAVADQGEGFETDAATSFVTGSVLANDSDPDGDPLSVTAVDTTATVGEVVGQWRRYVHL